MKRNFRNFAVAAASLALAACGDAPRSSGAASPSPTPAVPGLLPPVGVDAGVVPIQPVPLQGPLPPPSPSPRQTKP